MELELKLEFELEWEKAGTWGILMTSALAPDVFGLRPEGEYT